MIPINIPKKFISFFKQSAEQLKELRVQQIPSWFDKFPLFREWNTEQAINEGLKSSVWVYACVNKISKAVTSVDWIVEQKNGDEWERVENHPVEQLLYNPNANPLFTGETLFELEVNHRQLGGNAIWHKVMYDGVPVELWPIKPDRIYPLVNEDGTIDNYEYRPEGTAKRKLIPADEIVHFLFADPSNFYWGMSPLQAAGRVVDTDVQALKYNKETLDNSVIPSGVFSFKSQQMSPEQYAEVREELSRQADNPGRPFVIGNDASWESITFSAEELQITNTRQLNGREIHAAFDVDPLLTSFPDSGGQVNKKEAKHEFWQDNIIPYLNSLKQGINNQIIPHFGDPDQLRANYDLSDVEALREDQMLKIEKAERLYNMGVPFNQINQRLELGFDEVPGGDDPGNTGQPQQEASLNLKTSKKKEGKTEEYKLRYWKSMEEQRQEWEDRLAPELLEFFEEESEKVISAFEEGGEEAVRELLQEEEQEEMESILLSLAISVSEHFGEQEVERLEEEDIDDPEDIDFDLTEDEIEEIEEYVHEQSRKIQDTTQEAIVGIIAEGLRDNLSNDEIADNIDEQYNKWTTTDEDRDKPRYRSITETEVHTNQERGILSGGMAVVSASNVNLEKTWITMQDDRVRENHVVLHNETVGQNETFSNGLRFPGDPDGSPEQIINCRCDLLQSVI